MDLKMKDVAELLSVSETTIRRWLKDGKIPAYRLNRQYRFSRTEIEDWVMKQKVASAGGVFGESVQEDEAAEGSMETGGMRSFSLLRAIHHGGVFHNIPGKTKRDIIVCVMQKLSTKLDCDADVVSELLLDRERLMPTALNNGIAVPHTRDFLLRGHHDAIALIFPKEPLDYGALDGQPVHSLFFLFACDDKRHLNLLAKLAHLSSQGDFLTWLKTKPSEKEVFARIKEWEVSQQLVKN